MTQVTFRNYKCVCISCFKYTKLNQRGEDVKTIFILHGDQRNRNIPVLQYNVLAYNTSDARMCTQVRKLTYATILVWLRLLSVIISGDTTYFLVSDMPLSS